MGHREFIAFSATLGITISFAIDAILPAFDDMKLSLDLAPESNQLALSITAYLVTMSLGQMFYGPLADRFGRKPTLFIGLAICVVGVALSTFATSLAVLLAGRAIWGLGAASIRVLANTLARDLYEGDAMTRVLSLVMAVFLLGPVFAPLIGEALLSFTTWRVVFALCGTITLIIAAWSIRLVETLPPEARTAPMPNQTRDAVRAVLTNRQTMGNTLSVMFVFAILATFLASSQLVIDEIYERADQYAVLFSVLSAGSVLAALANTRAIDLLGSRRVVLMSSASFVVTGGFLSMISIAADGHPDFWVWFAATTIMIGFVAILLPTATSVALNPLGHIAGTASAVVGTVSAGFGSVLGAVVDSQISDSVTPMSVSALVFGLLAHASARWAQDGSAVGEPAA